MRVRDVGGGGRRIFLAGEGGRVGEMVAAEEGEPERERVGWRLEGLLFFSTSLRRGALGAGWDCLVKRSMAGRRASASWTVRVCLCRASERVKDLSHSE